MKSGECSSEQLADPSLTRYDWNQTYDWNYRHAPQPLTLDVPPVAGSWDYCGLPINSPLGISAGPLLNGRWILYYASLGFDVLTYKTVRSQPRGCYTMPNLQPVAAQQIGDSNEPLVSSAEMQGSWAVSFGMPSKHPELWRADVAATRLSLAEEKLLSVSVVATPQENWTIDDIALDFARCARWAVGGGADCIEANFSCPNVHSADGQLYHQPAAAAKVAEALREAIGSKPLLIKIGHVTEELSAVGLCRALAPHADGLVMVNCIASRIADSHRRAMFDGEPRGIAGKAIRAAVLRQVQLFARVIAEHSFPLRIVGVGGIGSARDVRSHLEAGSHTIQLATAAMMDPGIGIQIRHSLATGQ